MVPGGGVAEETVLRFLQDSRYWPDHGKGISEKQSEKSLGVPLTLWKVQWELAFLFAWESTGVSLLFVFAVLGSKPRAF
jgi:hypothetical protein